MKFTPTSLRIKHKREGNDLCNIDQLCGRIVVDESTWTSSGAKNENNETLIDIIMEKCDTSIMWNRVEK